MIFQSYSFKYPDNFEANIDTKMMKHYFLLKKNVIFCCKTFCPSVIMSQIKKMIIMKKSF